MAVEPRLVVPIRPAGAHEAPPTGTVLLLGLGPLLGKLADALSSRGWVTTRAHDVVASLPLLQAVLPRAILVHPADLREARMLFAAIARTENARGLPLLAVLDESPGDPDALPPGADAYLVDPSPDDLMAALDDHVVTAWSRSLGGQHALDILESLDDGVLVIDRAQRVVHHNPAGLAFVQRTTRRSGTLLGRALEAAVPAFAAAHARSAVRAALIHGATSHFELRLEPLWLSVDVFPNPDGATVVVRDTTERHTLEDALLETRMRLARSEKVAFLGELVAGVAHEVRTPLVSVGNHLELLTSETRRFVKAPSEEAALRIQQSIEHAWLGWERAVRIMKELQRITRLDPSVRVSVDLTEAMRDAIDLFAVVDPGSARVRADLEPGLHVHADVRKVQQVVLNLLQNAVEATTSTDGFVDVTTRRSADGRQATLVVRDAGPGMAPDIIERMYDPLFTTKKDGTGLGLGVVHRIVRDHGGAIACESAPGSGTVFTIRLPLI